MKGTSFKKLGKKMLKRVTSMLLVVVMLFTMMGIYIPADTFKAASSNYATVVGSFENLQNYNSNVTASWTPGDAGGKMESLGMKYHYKLITFDALPSDVAIEFKVAFNGSWDWSIGANGGTSNIAVTLPSGTTQLKVLTDESYVYYSIGDDTTVDDKLAGIYVNMAGNFASVLGNCSITEEWANTSNGTPRMEHLGNGFYYKHMTFDETASAVEISYKVTCNGTWDGINNSGGDINYTIPAGVSEIKFIADMNNYVLYNSIDNPDKIDE